MYRGNQIEQLSLTDKITVMSKSLQKTLRKSWAQTFRDDYFPAIDEAPFAVLYSDEKSRPNTPVNILVGLLLLKEIMQLSDEELIGSLHFDLRFQYALHTENMDKQPVSENSLTNFRNRVVNYMLKGTTEEERKERDLIKKMISGLSNITQKTLKVNGQMVRVDSLMVSSSCKNLTRIELVYNVNKQLIQRIAGINPTILPDQFKPYLEKGNKNEVIYRTQNSEVANKLQILITHSIALFQLFKNLPLVCDLHEFHILERMITDQTKTNEENAIIIKEGKEISSTSLQNPTDEDATYRNKYGNNTGYVANIVEAFDDEHAVIIDYDFEQNIHSDSKFSDDVIDLLAERVVDNEEILMIVDAAYFETEKAAEAIKRNVRLIPTELVGRKASKSYARFEIDEDTNLITKCPNGCQVAQSYYKEGSYTAKFKPSDCDGCPFLDQCPMKKGKKFNTVRVSAKRLLSDRQRIAMGTKQHRELGNKRAGIEGIPSVLRRRYAVDTMPVRGLMRSKLFFGFKIGAINFKRLVKFINSCHEFLEKHGFSENNQKFLGFWENFSFFRINLNIFAN